MNQLIRDSYALRVEAALAAARHAAAINHPGLEGEVREILVRELLRPIMPPTFAFGTGKIVDHQGNESDQIDVVVYDRAVLPPLLFSDMALLGLFPVEACVYAIEVKSTATSGTWKKASANATSLDRLVYLPTIQNTPRPPVFPMFFAFRTSHKSPPSRRLEYARWNRLNKQIPAPPVGHRTIDVSTFAAVCVAGQGYGYWKDPPLARDWTEAAGQHEEVITWFMGVSNTLFEATQRLPSRFGWYLG